MIVAIVVLAVAGFAAYKYRVEIAVAIAAIKASKKG